MMKLYQFPFSHFCEKSRWALDYKGLPYRTVDLAPGAHLLVTRRLAPASHVPILLHDNVVVQGSGAIVDYLDRNWPARPLTPADPALADSAAVWERDLDRDVGVAVRCWFYFHALPRPRNALALLTRGLSRRQQLMVCLGFPLLRPALRRGMRITAGNADTALSRLLAMLDRLEAALARGPFLAGDDFSRADLAACALLSPLVGIGQSEPQLAAALPEPVWQLRATLAERPVFDWVRAVYRQHRAAPAAVSCDHPDNVA